MIMYTQWFLSCCIQWCSVSLQPFLSENGSLIQLGGGSKSSSGPPSRQMSAAKSASTKEDSFGDFAEEEQEALGKDDGLEEDDGGDEDVGIYTSLTLGLDNVITRTSLTGNSAAR